MVVGLTHISIFTLFYSSESDILYNMQVHSTTQHSIRERCSNPNQTPDTFHW